MLISMALPDYLYSMRSVLIHSTGAGRPNVDGNEMHRGDMEIDTCGKCKNFKKIDEPGHFFLSSRGTQLSMTFEIVLKVVLEWNIYRGNRLAAG